MKCSRTEHICSFIVMDVLEKAQELEKRGCDIIHLEIGEPDFDTPLPIKQAGIRALEAGETHYTHSLGIQELREAICRNYEAEYGIYGLDPDQVVITSGTSPAFLVALGAVLEPGDELIITNPCYPCYPNFARFLGIIPKFVKVYEEEGFQYRIEDVKNAIGPRTKGILINSPANPTGHLLDADRLKGLAGLGLWIFSDEIYHGLVYDGERAHSILEFTDKCFVFNGFSKKYAMTGWRLGYVIIPKPFKRTVQCMVQNFFISANAASQRAALVALTDDRVVTETKKMVDEYDRRRKFMISRLKEIGFGIDHEPKGAFYVFANAKSFGSDSYRLAFELLEQAHVGVAPGIDFGTNGEGYLRFSYANSIEKIDEALNRIAQYLEQRKK
ncbi:pyridoxal phosphate-dependent aminotransferase [Thermodesulforhabdus norvegica]|uniref:Aminotransferase n=1 Tax=Thermodesulforhabdus norvegica TaxID=39841 RepID=A0A1I4U987_9BACT|nr:pyridoxal phosphate-dependent aminotransferase [Thermodesulforhabdus norvegica]SFM85559.1 Aspartate/methionine/tyrosine aminotransferase [Thermodesulforhabdus norvegica]